MTRTPGGDALTDIIMRTFHLNGAFLRAAEHISLPEGLTPSWWQVLGGVLKQPRSVADIAREMGMARQSVQRTADLLVEKGLAEYLPNPAHARAKLVQPSEAGWKAIHGMTAAQHAFTNRVAARFTVEELAACASLMEKLGAALAEDEEGRGTG
ncbi:MarR family winged helix-turn-helix transcriptional regulator [Actinokineospora sp. HUAS TT18]|uniref:MarR family winged helix-turn-helix transcriptional regulator n=1 Tax=Actinokineospora sp. HUAS TT18 TaxID=3447451 RepID=UPI003F5225A3